MQTELMDEIRSTLRDIDTQGTYIVNRYGDHQVEVCLAGMRFSSEGSGYHEQHLGYVTTCCEALTLIKTAEALQEKELKDGRYLNSEQGHTDIDAAVND